MTVSQVKPRTALAPWLWALARRCAVAWIIAGASVSVAQETPAPEESDAGSVEIDRRLEPPAAEEPEELLAPATGAPVSIIPAPAAGPFMNRPADELAADGQPGLDRAGDGASISDSPFAEDSDESVLGIAIDSLATIDPATVGVLDAENGGFGVDMWKGASRSMVETLLPRLPADVASPVLRSLRRRLLLSAADVPQGPSSGKALVSLRLERLSASGDLPGLVGLLERLGPNTDDEAVSRARADASLLVGDLAGACGEARAAVRRSDAPYWLKVSAFCRLLDGDAAGASLAIELLLEEGEDDAMFFALMERLLSGDIEDTSEPFDVGALVTLSPLDLGLLRASRQAAPPGAIVNAPALILRAIATSPATPINTRLQAADAAVQIGAMESDVLTGLFAALDFTDGERDSALVIAEADIGAKADALLYQQALELLDPQDQARLLNAAWRLARRSGNYPVIAQVNLEAAKSLTPSPELVWSATEISRALLLTGELDRVFEWYRVVRVRAAAGDLDATKALLDMWPLLQIADAEETLPWSEQILDLWWQGQTAVSAEDRIERGRLLFALLEALGQEVPADFWARLYAGPLAESSGSPNMAIWRGMVAAADNGHLGETVLLVLLALAEGGVGNSSPTILGSAIASLRSVGLEADARALALEAALIRGL